MSLGLSGWIAVIAVLVAAVAACRRARLRSELALEAHTELERKVAERTATLTRTQARLAEAADLAQLGSWEWDVAADTVAWSDELYRIYGLRPSEHAATFAGYLACVHPDDRGRVQGLISDAISSGRAFAFDERIVRPDGAVRILASHGQVHTDAHGSPLRLVGICQDVTESRHAERALRDSEARARLIIDGASDAFISTDENDVVTEWNGRAETLLGWTRDEALGRVLGELVVPERERGRRTELLQRFFDAGDAPWRNHRLERHAVHRDGHELALELTISTTPTETGCSFNHFLHDISERRQRERCRSTEHAVIQVLLESPTVQDARPRILEALATGLGWSAGAWWDVEPERRMVCCTELWQSDPGAARAAGLTYAVEVPLRSQGEIIAVLEFLAPEPLERDDLARLAEHVAQFVARKAAERSLREAEQRFHRAFADAGTGMALIGVNGDEEERFLEVNDALCGFTRLHRDELLATTIAAITHPDDLVGDRDLVRRLIDGGGASVQSETRLLGSEGAVVWIAYSTSVIRDGDGQPLYRIAQLQDVTERKHFEGQLQHLADHDPITGLYNRRRFEIALSDELESAARYRTTGAVLALDLDNFKFVNDTLGHSAGDELIATVAEILGARLRRTDTVARLGGDEFALLLPYVDEHQARLVADDLLSAIRRDAVVTNAKGTRRTTASIGIALFPELPNAFTSEALLSEADIAMYDAKAAGRDRACVYNAESSRQLSLEAGMTWREQIREALEEDRFTLYAQPIVPLHGGGPLHHELLVRMIGRGGEIVPPGAFLPVAERSDLILEIDRWVVRRAIEIAKREELGPDARLHVNLSARSLADADLPAHIGRLLASSGVDPSRLVFEITETAAIVNIDRAKQFAHHLDALGCGLALDDFGSGFASFYYIKHLPFGHLKIDGEFVESLVHNTTNQLIVQSVVAIARGLGKRTIAEYVGDSETLELLRSYGVDFAQGYFLGRPAAPQPSAALRDG